MNVDGLSKTLILRKCVTALSVSCLMNWKSHPERGQDICESPSACASPALCLAARNISRKRATTLSTFSSTFSAAPSVAVVDVEHHDCNVFVIVVVLLRLVHDLCLHLDDAVKGLVGDQCLVPDIQL